MEQNRVEVFVRKLKEKFKEWIKEEFSKKIWQGWSVGRRKENGKCVKKVVAEKEEVMDMDHMSKRR